MTKKWLGRLVKAKTYNAILEIPVYSMQRSLLIAGPFLSGAHWNESDARLLGLTR